MALTERKAVMEHSSKALVAAGETAIFTVGGIIYPPFFAGAVVTGLETARQTIKTVSAFKQIAIKESKL